MNQSLQKMRTIMQTLTVMLRIAAGFAGMVQEEQAGGDGLDVVETN